MRGKFSRVKALVFDVFGTVVDWRGSIVREARALARAKKLDLDPEAFADAWRAGYKPAMARVRSGELGWTRIDALHRIILDDLLERFAVRGLKEAEIENLNRLSDLAFVIGRQANRHAGRGDVLWQPGRSTK